MIEALPVLAPVLAWLAEPGAESALVLAASPMERRVIMRVLGAPVACMDRHRFVSGDRVVRVAIPEDGAETIQGERHARVWATDAFLVRTDRGAREMWREAWWRLGKGPPPVTCAIGEGAG